VSWAEATSTKTVSRYYPAFVQPAVDMARTGRVIHLATQDDLAVSKQFRHDSVAIEFKKHAKRWQRETRHISSPNQKYLHQSYARIIGLGWPVVKPILQALQQQPDDWFYALRAITGKNPVTARMAGDLTEMSKVWIKWGRERGLT
jgi:hypothetical protein